MANTTHDLLLNQLQYEVNEVWKQMGRLFAAVKVNGNGRGLPTGHMVKLKKMLPRSDERFQAALDALEEELQMATLVMRRDLAVCREKAGLQHPSAANVAPTATAVDIPDIVEADTIPNEAPDAAMAENVEMKDAEPLNASEPTASTTAEEAITQTKDPISEAAPSTEDLTLPDTAANPDTSEAINSAPEHKLHIDTQAQPLQKDSTNNDTAVDEDNPPGTADTANFSTTNDLDSLFGGPLSAGAGETGNFTLEPTATSEFDFDAFGADLDANDNISSLLPGLEDYASEPAAGGEEINFDDFFASTNDGDGTGIPHRDSTFDGLQDLADFNVDEFTHGGDGGAGEAEDFEFDFLKD